MTSKPQKLNLLLVDDKPHFLAPLQRMFKRHYELYTASLGTDALAIIHQIPIHIVLSDQKIPKMSGIDLLQAAKDESPFTVRLLMGDENDKVIGERAVKEGLAVRYLQKPWDSNDMRGAIKLADEIARAHLHSDHAVQYAASLQRNKGILILAEDVALCQLVYQLFGATNTVYQAVELDEAVAILSKREIALTLLDVSLFAKDSIKVSATLKKISPALLFILLADQKESGLVVKLNTQGNAFRCLTKPTKSGLLKLAINSALKYYEQRLSEVAADAAHASANTEGKASGKTPGLADRMKSFWRH